ncbi:Aste57867_14281 [Aphanomyces stellatus]|uniref:Aste57867_14281 protein n=1 Tax=Aphanomyces stellatus TaxID=120398 RepID=A0A485L1Y5_9STRA|nr:hypothetical protein As57867_014229 [Aphanomyces stellatus]VFT91106.1 Aste57867_14281 [Aphanomyces stellatus]
MAEAPRSISPSKESSMRRCPGNDRCADCNKVFPQWASVTFGILLCLECAGKHRALGVQTSFVKSMAMDTWAAKDLLAMEVGGNGKWNAVCQAGGLHLLSTADKYASAIAAVYRARMVEAVETATPFTLVGVLTDLNLPLDVPQSSPVRRHTSLMHMTTSPPPSPVKVHLRKQASLEVKCTLCHDFVALSLLDAHSSRCDVAALPPTDDNTYEELEFETVLGKHPTDASPLGLSLSKAGNGGDTVVSKVTPGGDADLAGVIVGSAVLGINTLQTTKFDDLMRVLPSLARPISFTFRIRRAVHVEEIELSAPPPLGCSFTLSIHNQTIVSVVDPAGHAAAQGLVQGSSVVAVNGVTTDVYRALQAAAKRRPLRLRVHRYVAADSFSRRESGVCSSSNSSSTRRESERSSSLLRLWS